MLDPMKIQVLQCKQMVYQSYCSQSLDITCRIIKYRKY